MRHVDQKHLYAMKLLHYNSSVSQRGQHRVLNRKGENKNENVKGNESDIISDSFSFKPHFSIQDQRYAIILG